MRGALIVPAKGGLMGLERDCKKAGSLVFLKKEKRIFGIERNKIYGNICFLKI